MTDAPRFVRFQDPDLSVVVVAACDVTLAGTALKALALFAGDVRFEVIVVDDACDPETAAMLAGVDGIELIVHTERAGLLAGWKAGAQARRGRHLLVVDATAEIGPGTLEALLESVESVPEAGIVGAKLRYADGALREAGAYVDPDGRRTAYGDLADPGASAFNYVRAVDCCAGACLLVRDELVGVISGLSNDSYAATDLCFEARERGYQVLYQPRADAVWRASDEPDWALEAGRSQFAAKWKQQLARHAGPSSAPEAIRAHADGKPLALVIDEELPCHPGEARSARMNELIDGLDASGYRVVVAAWGGSLGAWELTQRLGQRGIEVVTGEAMRDRVAELTPVAETILFGRPVMALQMLAELYETAPAAHLVEVVGDPHANGSPRGAALMAEFERAAVRGAGIALVPDAAAAARVTEDVPDAPVVVWPSGNGDDLRGLITRATAPRGGRDETAPPAGAQTFADLAAGLPAHKARLAEARSAITEDVPWYQFDILGNVQHLAALCPGELASLDRISAGAPVADIGAADGDLAFTLEHAAGWEVDVIDTASANHNGLRGARLLKEQLGSSVAIHDIDLDSQFRLPRERYGFVLLLGILYHLQNPYYVLRQLAGQTRYLALSTRVARFAGLQEIPIADLPVAYLVRPDELNDDPTNYWVFSPAGLYRLVERSGWRVVAELDVGDTEGSVPHVFERDERIFMLLESTLS